MKHRRTLGLELKSVAPSGPSVGLMRAFLASDVEEISAPPKPLAIGSVWDPSRGAVRPYSPSHIIAALDAGQHLSNKSFLRPTLASCMKMAFPHLRKQATISIPPVVSGQTWNRNVVRLDLASMLSNRSTWKAMGPAFRYLAYDASPQGGQEFFVSVERVMRRSELDKVSKNMFPAVSVRSLPLCVLGCNRMGVASKMQAHVHQVWLDYGPAVEDVRSANLAVRQCLSDMGGELGIGDAHDLVGSCLGQPGLDKLDKKHLYPLALVVPGPQHILDGALRLGLETLPWWPAWQRSAKIVLQWLHPKNRRVFLQHKLKDSLASPQDMELFMKILDCSCESFAQWRWKTLGRVTSHLARLRPAVQVATEGLQPGQIASKDSGIALEFLQTVRDDVFWCRGIALGQLCRPLTEFSSWLRGCECHERERMSGRPVQCQWAGCRAKGLASRCGQLCDQLHDMPGAVCECPEVAIAATAVLANLRMKLDWVHHQPFLVWQAGIPL